MNFQKQIEYWLETAEHDLDAANALFEKNKYDWCLYLGHLVLEKALKAHYVKKNKEIPPRTHNLVRLAEKVNLDLSEEQIKFLATATEFNIEVRYPDEKMEFYKLCTKRYGEENFLKIKEMYQWLLKQIKQQ